MYKLAFLFPGQGAHFVGMGKGIYDQYQIVRDTFDEIERVSQIDVKKLCFEGRLAELSRTRNAHICTLACALSAFRVFMQEVGYVPQFLAGHSLGEYIALTAAGVWSLEDAVKLISLRAEIADRAAKESDGGMSIVENVSNEEVARVVNELAAQGKKVYISSYTTRNQTAISGNADDMRECEEQLFQLGANITPLFGSAPYHSKLMSPYVEELKDAIRQIKTNPFRYPVISNVTGRPYKSVDELPESLAKHFSQTVLWTDTMDYLDEKGISLIIEMSPKNLLTNIVKSDHEDMKAICLCNKMEREEIFDLYQNTEIYSKHIPTIITKCLVAAVSTPNKNWDNEAYEKGVVKPYGRIQEIQDQYTANTIELDQGIKKEVLSLLKCIFETKMLPKEEQQEWFSQILEETGNQYLFPEFLS